MKKLSLLVVILALLVASCGKKAADYVNTIPDDAFLVVSVHPKQIFDKGQISSLEGIKKEVKNDFARTILEDPAKSGVTLTDYAYLFMYLKNDSPIIGVVAGLDNKGEFEDAVKKINEDEVEFTDNGNQTMYIKGDGMMAWDDSKVLFLTTTDMDMSVDDWKEESTMLFSQAKEESVTSVVDFNNFIGKMKDVNAWMSSDKLKTLMEKAGQMQGSNFQLPMQLYNNYGQFFCEFTNEGIFVTSETHFSEEVEKNTQFLIAKPELNKALLENTPGNDLLMAMAFSLDLKELRELMDKIPKPDDVTEMEGRVEQMTGMSSEQLWDALSGDFVIAINGTENGGMIPVEAFIGIGVNNEALEQALMGQVQGMVDVQKDGDFFMINANGIELYSGIVDGIWVITNAKGYKDAVTGSGLDKNLTDSKFNEYAGGSMGMYMNLDLSTYPAALQQMMSQNDKLREGLEDLSSAFTSIGVEADNKESNMEMKSVNTDENSLYTILKMADKEAMN